MIGGSIGEVSCESSAVGECPRVNGDEIKCLLSISFIEKESSARLNEIVIGECDEVVVDVATLAKRLRGVELA